MNEENASFRSLLKYVVPVVVFSILFNAPKFYEADIGYEANSTSPQLRVSDLRKDPNYTIYYNNYARLTVLGIVPFVMLLFFNTKIYQDIQVYPETKKTLRGYKVHIACPDFVFVIKGICTHGLERISSSYIRRATLHLTYFPKKRKQTPILCIPQVRRRLRYPTVPQSNTLNSMVTVPANGDAVTATAAPTTANLLAVPEDAVAVAAANQETSFVDPGGKTGRSSSIIARTRRCSRGVRRRTSSKLNNYNARRRRQEDNLATIFMAIILFFLVAHSLRIVLALHEMIIGEEPELCHRAGKNSFAPWVHILTMISHLLLALNCSVNSLIYCGMSSRFRSQLRKQMAPLGKCFGLRGERVGGDGAPDEERHGGDGQLADGDDCQDEKDNSIIVVPEREGEVQSSNHEGQNGDRLVLTSSELKTWGREGESPLVDLKNVRSIMRTTRV